MSDQLHTQPEDATEPPTLVLEPKNATEAAVLDVLAEVSTPEQTAAMADVQPVNDEPMATEPASEEIPPHPVAFVPESPAPEATTAETPIEPPVAAPDPATNAPFFRRLLDRMKKPQDVVEAIENLIPQEKTVLDLRYELVEAVEAALRPHRRRGIIIPYNLAILHIYAETPQEQQKYVSAIADVQPSLHDAILEKLTGGRYALPDDFQVDFLIYPEKPVQLSDAFQENAVYVELAKRTAATLTAKMTLIKGAMLTQTITLQTTGTYNVGRLPLVQDGRGQMMRENHIHFIDPNQLDPADPNRRINDTVSRMHGRIQYDNKRSKFVYFNEQGSTSFYRTGFTSSKKLITGQSVPLEPGDTLYLGSACLRFDG